jgi:tetratricopeptide (TPR) repeat protein
MAYELYQKAGGDQMNDPSQALLSDIHFNLGAIANETNDWSSCLENNILLLRMRESISSKSGKPDLRLGIAYNQMGVADTMIGKYALATEFFRRSIQVYQALDDFEVDMLAFPRANLGFALWVQGQFSEAEKVLGTALAEREKEFGKMDKFSYK